MHKVLIADDEELERRAMRRILGAPGMPPLEIVEAANGLEAIERAGGAGFSAAFLDIRMPGLDGMEVARKLAETDPNLSIVFLTAHDSFDYARSALRLRVEDFLLKPASAEEVEGALRKALRACEDARSAGNEGAIALRGGEALFWLAEELRADLAAGQAKSGAFFRYAGAAGRGGSRIAAITVRVELPGQDLEASNTVGSCPSRGIGMTSLLREAAFLIERRFAGEGLAAIAGAGIDFTSGMIAICDGTRHDDIFCDSIAALAADLRSGISRTLLVGASYPPEGAAVPPEGELLLHSRRASLFASIERPFLLLPAVPLEKNAADREDGATSSRAVRRAIQVMDERQMEDLSLEIVSAEVRCSSSHLSRLLVREIGIGFAECLSRLRVERARSLLRAGGLSVKEVTSIVGFRDPAYFARVFRRFSGMSPAEYRSRRSEGP